MATLDMQQQPMGQFAPKDEGDEPGSILKKALDLTGAVAEKLAEAFKPLCIERQEYREELDHKESTVYLRPSSEVSIPLGFDLFTCQDDFDLTRHFVMQPHNTAQSLELRAYDELLALDQECLVDLSHEEVLSSLAHIKMNSSFFLVIRRSLSIMEDKKEYEYIKFTAKMQENEGLPEDCTDGPGGSRIVIRVDISVTRSVKVTLEVHTIERRNIFCAGAGCREYYLCYINDQLQVKSGGFKPGLTNAVFDIMYCRLIFNTGMDTKWGMLVRCQPESTSKFHYLQVHKDHKVGFKGMYEKSDPTTADRSLIFRRTQIRKQVFALECESLKGYYLCKQGTRLVVEHVDSDRIHDEENAHFTTFDAKYSENSM